jgi:hypothetical protein
MFMRLPILAGTIAVVAIGAASSVPQAAARVQPSAPDSLASPASAGATTPNLAVAPDGKIYMSWLEPADSGFALKFAVLDGHKWSAPRTVRKGGDFFVNWADFSSMEVLDGGRLAAHWLQRNGTSTYAYGVRVSQSTDGGRTWSTPVIPHRDSSQNEHGFVAMWRERNQLGAVWLDGRKFKPQSHDAPGGHGPSTNEMMLVSTTLDARGRHGAEVILDERACDCCQNSAAVTSNGPIIAYRNRSPEEIRDIYVTRRVNGKWIPGVPVHNDNWKIAACPVNGPNIDARGRRVAIAWFSAPNDSATVKLAFSDDAGANFSAPIRIDQGRPSGRVDVALLSDGGALVTWIERTGGDTAAVRARRVSAQGQVGMPVTIASSSAARASGFPRMALTGNDVVFAWTVPGRPSAIRVARVPLAELK